MSICLIWSTTLRTLRLWQKLVVEIPEPLATQQFFTGPQVIGTSWYNNPESLAKARINILMWRAIQLYNLPQGKVPSTQRTSLWPNLYLLYFSLLWQMLRISFGSTPHHLSLSQICDLSTLSSFCTFTSPKGSEIRDYEGKGTCHHFWDSLSRNNPRGNNSWFLWWHPDCQISCNWFSFILAWRFLFGCISLFRRIFLTKNTLEHMSFLQILLENL